MYQHAREREAVKESAAERSYRDHSLPFEHLTSQTFGHFTIQPSGGIFCLYQGGEMSTIIISNQKGGSSKTTTTIHLGAGLAAAGQRVLMVDMDPQGHLAEGLGYSAFDFDKEISLVLDGKLPISEVIISIRPNLDLAPSNIRLSHLEPLLITRHRREDKLKNALAPILAHYDSILIDCPPSLGILTVNALSAADQVLIPMVVDYYSMLGVSLLLETISQMRTEINPQLQVMGLLPTRYTRTVNAREVLEQTKEGLQDQIHIYETPVPETVKFREAAALGKTIYEHAPDSAGAEAYLELVRKVWRNGA
jgi:chromosome partitioning protein